MLYLIKFPLPCGGDLSFSASIEATATIAVGKGLVIGQNSGFYYEKQKLPTKVPIGWKELQRKDGKPLADPIRILKAFNHLASDGWLIDSTQFYEAYSYRFSRTNADLIKSTNRSL